MMDIMYFGYGYGKDDHAREYQSDFINEVKKFFPNVRLEDAYNEIKGYRQSVYLEDSEKDNYLAYLIGKGWIDFSLTLQIAMMDKDELDNIKGWFKLAKQQYPEAFKPEAFKPDALI